MQRALFLVGIAIVAGVVGIALGSASWVFWDAWKSSDLEAFRALVGAFAGAFFAYAFVRFGDGMKKIYDRKEANHTALVKLQRYFNDCLNTTSDNIFIVNDCTKVFTPQRLASAEVPIFMNSYHMYAIDRDTLGALTNVDSLNEVYSLNVDLHKMNDSLATTDRAYAQLRDALLAKTVDVPTYKENAARYRDRSIEMLGFLEQLKDDLVQALAASNLLLRDRPFLAAVVLRLVRSVHPPDFPARLALEKRRVLAEIESNAAKSRAKINAAQQRK